MKMGIKGDVLREWKNNISNIHECIRAKFGSVTSYVLFFWWFFFFFVFLVNFDGVVRNLFLNFVFQLFASLN